MPLTSNGPANDTLRPAFVELLGKPRAEAGVAAIVTASLGQPGDHGWFVEAFADLRDMAGASSTCSTSTAGRGTCWRDV